MVKAKNLSPEQQEAIDFISNSQLIIGAAGTGKTCVITHKIANLVNSKKAKPSEILAFLISNKAANNLIESVQKIIGNKTEFPFIFLRGLTLPGYVAFVPPGREKLRFFMRFMDRTRENIKKGSFDKFYADFLDNYNKDI